MWISFASFLTPTFLLFFVLNLTIFTIFITSILKRLQKLSDDQDNSPLQIIRVPPFLKRVKSINFSIYNSERSDQSDTAAHQTTASPPPEEPTHQRVEESPVTRSRSDTCVQAPTKRVLEKSLSEKVYVAKPEPEPEQEQEQEQEEEEEEEETESSNRAEDQAWDAKADDFIGKFRQQLKLQRLGSDLRYNEMLNN